MERRRRSRIWAARDADADPLGLFNLALHGWRWPIERLLQLADADGLRLWAPEPGVPTEVVRGKNCERTGGAED